MDARHLKPTAHTTADATLTTLPIQQRLLFQNSLNSSLTVRLDRTNFLVWKSQGHSHGRGNPSIPRLLCQYADTGATNHIAQGMEHIESEIPYSGSDTLAVGNGKRLAISHVADNNVYLEFHSKYCFVKDKITGRVLLKGRLQNGLYTPSRNSFPSSKV
uniref:Uncharacterized protein n=1 Tax=Cannabis sativa TaxID=3483 RepID=A0A803NTT3_CANSA